jgi:glutamate dehydrogenase (NADP+)
MLSEKGMSLEGKRCIITGSNYVSHHDLSPLGPLFRASDYFLKVALAVAEKLLELGAIPLTFTDSSGQLYEPDVRTVNVATTHIVLIGLA